MSLEGIFTSLLLIFVVIWVVWVQVRASEKDIGPIEHLREQADRSLVAFNIYATDSKFSFVGSDVEVLDRKEEVFWWNQTYITSYKCSYFVRSKLGEYYMFIYRHGKKPYVKHSSQTIARVKLGSKYLPPVSNG
jgi:hypothetical protein